MVDLRYSGGPGNQFAVSSLGGAMSSESIPDASLGNLFDDVNRVEVINGRIEHRCFFILNDSGGDFLKLKGITLVIPADTEISFAVDESAVPQLLPTEDSTPVGLSFLNFDEWNTLEIPIGTLDDTKAIAMWIRRKVVVGSDLLRTISMVLDAIDNTITITQDFGSIENNFDNKFIKSRSPLFLWDVDLMGESLWS